MKLDEKDRWDRAFQRAHSFDREEQAELLEHLLATQKEAATEQSQTDSEAQGDE